MIPAQLLMAELPYSQPAPTIRPSLNTWAGLQGPGTSGVNTSGAAAVTVGQFVVAFIHWGKAGTLPNLTAVSDTLGNTWTSQVAASNTSQTNKHRLEIWTSRITVAGSMQLRATLDAAPSGITIDASVFDLVDTSNPFVLTPTIQQNDSGSSVAPSGTVSSSGLTNCLLVAVPCGPGSSLSQSNSGWTEWGGPLASGLSGQDHFKRNLDADYTITGDWSSAANWMLAFAPLRGLALTTFAPSAVLTTFDYTGQGALPAQLYDGSDSTPSADSRGLQTDTSAAFDLGSARTVTNVRLKVSDTFGFTSNTTFKIQYSDVSLSSGWTDSGATITGPSGTGSIVNSAVSAGSHRYWRIFYVSGSTGSTNVWIGELSFQG